MEDNQAGSLPFGIKYSKRINQFTILCSGIGALIGLVLAAFAIPSFFKSLSHSGGHHALAGFGGTLFILLLFSGIWVVPIPLLIGLNKGLARCESNARKWQMILSVVLLLFFPIGTVLYGISLYFMLFDSETKAAFGIK